MTRSWHEHAEALDEYRAAAQWYESKTPGPEPGLDCAPRYRGDLFARNQFRIVEAVALIFPSISDEAVGCS